MYLKNLTALGFKSFADKTSLDFQPGVTAIVGPNGCGKSNVSDALRWVLGEQSAKALRGSGMADVIFNGTDKRKALSMAEVSLTIGGIDSEQLKTAGVDLPYNEVTVTRRIFRDGGSEYFINKVSCRLRDIQQLFMGTGMGRASYGIMAQGNITQLISSKPDDRRLVFEEAAGITRFKQQKREALRKLDYTEQNLLRVSDTIREVKRQIGSLQRQAAKAKRYKEFMGELQSLEGQLARHQLGDLQNKVQLSEKAIAEFKDKSDDYTETIASGERQINEARQQRAAIEKQVTEAQEKGANLQAELERLESRIQFSRERIGELDDQVAKAHEDIAEAERRRSDSEAELTEMTNKLGTADNAVADKRVRSRKNRQRARPSRPSLANGRRRCASADRVVQRGAGVDPCAQRTERARPAKARQHGSARKTFGGKDPARGGTGQATGAAWPILERGGVAQVQRAKPPRHGGGTPAAPDRTAAALGQAHR